MVGLALTGAVALFVEGEPGLGAVTLALAVGVVSIVNASSDGSQIARSYASTDLVGWATSVAAADGDRPLGGAIAALLFGAAAEREGALSIALDLYEASLDDVTLLAPDDLAEELGTFAAARGALLAHHLGQRERGLALLALLDRQRAQERAPEIRRRLELDHHIRAFDGDLNGFEVEARALFG